MSGAAEGIAGLALSAVSVAALFTTCIECFDIVVAGKNFSEDYEQLCTLFSLQRVRFGLWGESVGLIPSPHDGRKVRYNKNLDRSDIRPGLDRTLHNIKSLLDQASQVDDRYGNKSPPPGWDLSTSRGLNVFKTSFERFKTNIKRHQKKTSAWKVTRWAIHDADKFEALINRLKDFVDGLESITKSLGLLEEQHTRLQQEIESISDTESLRLLRDASSRYGSSHHDVSDTASRRLITVAESIIERRTLQSGTGGGGTAESFITARSGLSTVIDSSSSLGPVPGAWPQLTSAISSYPKLSSSRQLSKYNEGGGESCKHGIWGEPFCPRCLPTGKSYPSDTTQLPSSGPPTNIVTGTIPAAGTSVVASSTTTESVALVYISSQLPQNQRLLGQLLARAKPRQPQSFAAGDSDHGKKLATLKAEDEDRWVKQSVKYLTQASSGSSAAKRMFFELRHIKEGKVPFVSAVPVGDSLTRVLASIEGPPETPYEGGIFWIIISFPDNDPHRPPIMRFHTKIYHPNISPQGHICADYSAKWNAVLSGDNMNNSVKDPQAMWYQPKKNHV
ncbi:uncharacterized protein LY89DRAFT_122019 [Mollisia scopiformis]|uniref:UBC core domain-containing protein n=1 Tax=Mollisia scopiformis TaxID=149040 RepID=A0A194X3Z4_MOLSC|nr:uncharacterized protein LY89DRAFT_122019 [Mollisia scopiformis]KUJ14769.1 hypothetical protein LY89DRAFT_122019 [Mollisia scopiformis]